MRFTYYTINNHTCYYQRRYYEKYQRRIFNQYVQELRHVGTMNMIKLQCIGFDTGYEYGYCLGLL